MLVKSVRKDGVVQPFDRFTEYFATPKEAQVLDAPMEEGGFNENFGVVQKEFEIYE